MCPPRNPIHLGNGALGDGRGASTRRRDVDGAEYIHQRLDTATTTSKSSSKSDPFADISTALMSSEIMMFALEEESSLCADTFRSRLRVTFLRRCETDRTRCSVPACSLNTTTRRDRGSVSWSCLISQPVVNLALMFLLAMNLAETHD